MTTPCFITGLGYYVPPRVLTNNELAGYVDTSDEWIRTRTGIEERHLADEGVFTSDLAMKAAQDAIKMSGLEPKDITHVITATFASDALCPSTASRVQKMLGISGGFALDINAACSGFVYGLELAYGILAARPSAKVLLVAAEVLSLRCNWKDRSTCVLFGDGAGAAVLETGRPSLQAGACSASVEAVLCDSNAELGELLSCLGGGSRMPYKLGDTIGDEYFIHMQGREVFKHAVRSMSGICSRLLAEQNLTLDDIDLFIPHQANLRIIEAVGERLGITREKVFVNVQKYGNTSAASVPLALGEAFAAGRIKPGMRVLLATFGAGFTWGAALLKF